MANIEVIKISDELWEIPRQAEMHVPGRIFASEILLNAIRNDDSLRQVMNVAFLPGIIGYSYAMPDIHCGYGFPIGGVAAMNLDEGVISPGGVGYDINCGVRLIRTNLSVKEVKTKIKALVTAISHQVPSGVGSHGAIAKLTQQQLRQVSLNGARWAIEQGYGNEDDLEFIEDRGMLTEARPDCISTRAFERGATQMGTLGSGNHFIEVSQVVELFDEQAASAMQLFPGQIVVIVHTGSRGFGYQICDDFLKTTLQAARKYGISLPDRQLACAPLSSPEGQEYLGAMRAAANFAFANRQVIHALIEKALLHSLQIAPRELGFRLVWDIAHNIAKIEEHQFAGKKIRVCVHRKGATRAFPPNHPDLPMKYQTIGQPVLIPGDMGTESYLCVGTQKAMEETFGSSCHGAGRVLSRHAAKEKARKMNLFAELEKSGVFVLAQGKETIAEEMPFAYKDVRQVVETMHRAGITRKVARFTPLGVVKG